MRPSVVVYINAAFLYLQYLLCSSLNVYLFLSYYLSDAMSLGLVVHLSESLLTSYTNSEMTSLFLPMVLHLLR